MLSREEFEAMTKAREEAVVRIITSTARRKLIVASAGTGKTYTFKRALQAAGGGGLALTFIRNLVRDLKAELSELADVFTFHGFCTHLLHQIRMEGITPDFDFYPSLPVLVAKDIEALGGGATSKGTIEGRFHDLDETDGLIKGALRLGDYYDAVSFIDVVYRVLHHLEATPEDIPAYRLVVVDEYQDFSLLETHLIKQLAYRSPILVAGDDDQALYTFKHASAIYIRELASNREYESFELPFCSRCPAVIVDAVERVVAMAQKSGRLAGRLARSYQCFLPEKGEDSERHPKIIHARCSVENKRAPYVCRYVAEEIARIPPQDIQESHEKGYPTVLVIGPGQFMRRVHQFLKEGPFPNAELRAGDDPKIDPLDGYQRIATRAESRLGWRILIQADPFPGWERVVAKAVREGTDLIGGLPDEYRVRHLPIAALIGRLRDGEELCDKDRSALETALTRPFSTIQNGLAADEGEAREDDMTRPSIVCTTLVGAKGLSAGYVFIVGFNDGHFPRDPRAISDEDICKFIVGLSRTRKECHLVSCVKFGKEWLAESSFLGWVGPLTVERRINKSSWM